MNPSSVMRISRSAVALRAALAIVMLGLAWSAPAQRSAVSSGQEVLRRMHAALAPRWYRTLAFDQTNTAYDSIGGETHSVWHEFVFAPGRLRIEYEPAAEKSGALVRSDSAYRFVRGELRGARPYVEPFALLLSDVYVLPPERTAHLLDSLGFSLSTVHDRKWNGREVTVVGGPAGDSTSPQFWVDRRAGLVVRVIQTDTRRGARVTTDVRVLRRAGPPLPPVETELLFLENGRPVWRERYGNLRVNPAFPDSLFDPSRFASMVGFKVASDSRPAHVP
jgi:hypothetical protein